VDKEGFSSLSIAVRREVAGFEVFEAKNATDWIVVTRKEKSDVIIIDVRLPDMRGSEAARILREDKATSGIPIVFVTVSAMAGE
jgi:CheY-like chemotaxis protein